MFVWIPFRNATMKSLVIILMVSFSLCAASDPSEKKYEVEARGKAKYALLSEYFILFRKP